MCAWVYQIIKRHLFHCECWRLSAFCFRPFEIAAWRGSYHLLHANAMTEWNDRIKFNFCAFISNESDYNEITRYTHFFTNISERMRPETHSLYERLNEWMSEGTRAYFDYYYFQVEFVKQSNNDLCWISWNNPRGKSFNLTSTCRPSHHPPSSA